MLQALVQQAQFGGPVGDGFFQVAGRLEGGERPPFDIDAVLHAIQQDLVGLAQLDDFLLQLGQPVALRNPDDRFFTGNFLAHGCRRKARQLKELFMFREFACSPMQENPHTL